MYLGDFWFEFRPGHKLCSLETAVVLLTPFRQFYERNNITNATVSMHKLFNLTL